MASWTGAPRWSKIRRPGGLLRVQAV